MKTNKIVAAALIALGLLSCKSESIKEAPQQNMDYPVAFSIEGSQGDLRADQTGTSVTASYDYERAIENLTVIVFNNRGANNEPAAIEKVITNDQLVIPADPYKGQIKFDMGIPGTFHLEVIANAYKEGDEAAKKAFLSTIKLGMMYDQFTKVVFERPLVAHGEKGFAMLTTEPVKVTTYRRTTRYADKKIVLRRFACRFDIFNKLKDDLELTEVRLKNQIEKSFMLPQKNDLFYSLGTEKTYKANGDWFTGTVVSGGIYSYENLKKGATTLELYGKYKTNVAWHKTIEFKDAEGNPIVIQRNHIYRVTLSKGNGTTPGGNDPENADKVNFEIEVLDWTEADLKFNDDETRHLEQTNNRYEFSIDKKEYPELGGVGHVSAKKYVYAKESGTFLWQEPLPVGDFTISLKEGDPAQITIDNATGTFTIAKGVTVADFKLEMKANEPNAKGSDFDVQRVVNPLRYMAEANIDQAGTGFVTDLYDTKISGYWNVRECMAKFNPITIGNEQYHMPTLPEWKSIATQWANTIFNNPKSVRNLKQHVSVGGKELICLQDIEGYGKGKAYALRFKGTAYCSVWRYAFGKIGDYNVLKIMSMAVKDDVKLEDVANEAFWEQNESKCVVRILPACGMTRLGDHDKAEWGENERGYYQCAPDEDKLYWTVFAEYAVYPDQVLSGDKVGMSVRLFRDTVK